MKVAARNLIPLLITFLAVTVVVSLAFYNQGTKPYSRKVMEFTQSLVTEDMTISPPKAARTYAYISTLYYNVLSETDRPGEAVLAATKLLQQLYPNQNDAYKFDRFFTSLNIDPQMQISTTTQNLLNQMLAKEKDEASTKSQYVRLSGKQYWNGESPLGIEALAWQSWIVDKSYTNQIPLPPEEKSEEQKKAIENSIWITSIRTPEQGALINFWSGMHMTPGLAGIWQNRLYDVTSNYKLTDKEYAYTQMVLSQSLADTFIDVWKIKYTYWTKRPSTYDPKINISMTDPNYPSYISEYSAVAITARNVLAQMFPDGKNIWDKDLENASSIGLWAGCAFSYDEKNGEVLGNEISKQIINKLNLTPLTSNWLIPLEVLTPKVGVYKRSQ